MRDAELGRRCRDATILKRDLFSTIERGWYQTDSGDVGAVLRRIDGVPRYSRVLARILFKRAVRARRRAPE